MDESSGDNPPGMSRRSFLKKAAVGLAALLGGGVLLHETTKPNPFQEKAQQLWQEYQANPQQFIQKYPDLVKEGLVIGPDGAHVRTTPSAVDRNNITGFLNPNEQVVIAIKYPESITPKDIPNPTGGFITQERGGQMVFIAESQTITNPSAAQSK